MQMEQWCKTFNFDLSHDTKAIKSKSKNCEKWYQNQQAPFQHLWKNAKQNRSGPIRPAAWKTSGPDGPRARSKIWAAFAIPKWIKTQHPSTAHLEKYLKSFLRVINSPIIWSKDKYKHWKRRQFVFLPPSLIKPKFIYEPIVNNLKQ